MNLVMTQTWGKMVWAACLLLVVMVSTGCSKPDAATEGSTEIAKTEKRTPTAQEISDFVSQCTYSGTMTEAACHCAAERVLVDHSQDALNRAQMGTAYEKKKAIFAYIRQVRPINQACDAQFPPPEGSQLARVIEAQDQEEREFFAAQLSMAPSLAYNLCSTIYEDQIKLCGTEVIDCAIAKARAQHSDVVVTDFFDGVSHTDQFKDFLGGFLQQCLAEQPALAAPTTTEENGTQQPASDTSYSFDMDSPVNDNQPNG